MGLPAGRRWSKRRALAHHPSTTPQSNKWSVTSDELEAEYPCPRGPGFRAMAKQTRNVADERTTFSQRPSLPRWGDKFQNVCSAAGTSQAARSRGTSNSANVLRMANEEAGNACPKNVADNSRQDALRQEDKPTRANFGIFCVRLVNAAAGNDVVANIDIDESCSCSQTDQHAFDWS